MISSLTNRFAVTLRNRRWYSLSIAGCCPRCFHWSREPRPSRKNVKIETGIKIIAPDPDHPRGIKRVLIFSNPTIRGGKFDFFFSFLIFPREREKHERITSKSNLVQFPWPFFHGSKSRRVQDNDNRIDQGIDSRQRSTSISNVFQILSTRAIVSRNTSVAEAVMELRTVHNIRDNIGKS